MTSLTVHRFTTGEAVRPVLVAVHGITANGLSFGPLAAELDARGVDVWAPDLRGRGASREVGEPYGLNVHADDLVPLLQEARDRTGRPAVLLGHSMGAFVSALVAARHPEVVGALILVDGGLAFPLPPGAGDDVDALIQSVIGPAMARLSMTFDSPQAYVDFWAEHPALGDMAVAHTPNGELTRAYLRHDLMPDGDGWRSTCVLEAVRADGRMTLTDAETHGAARTAVAAGVPTTLLWAPRGLLNEEQGLYDPDRLAALNLPAGLATRQIEDVNHYTILLDAVNELAETVVAASDA